MFRSLIRVISLFFFTLFCMGGLVFYLVLPRDRRFKAFGRTMQFWSKGICFIYGIQIRLEGGSLPLEPGYLVVSNHVTYFDIAVLGSLFPAAFVSKAQVRSWPVIGQAAVMAGTLFVDRDNERSRKQLRMRCTSRLRARQNIILFPEGTVTEGREVLPYRYGAFQIAIDADRPALPITICYEDPEQVKWVGNVDFLIHLFKLGRHSKIFVRLHVGGLVYPHVFQSVEDMTGTVHRWTERALRNMSAKPLEKIEDVEWNIFHYRVENAEQFMTHLLTTLIRIDSSTREGERQVCKVVREVMKRNHINTESYFSPNHHENLLATIGGDAKKSSILILANSDVVPASDDGWSHGPFSGKVEGGQVWGRGALDMKGLSVVFLASCLRLKNALKPNHPPLRFLLTADEEKGGAEGSRFMAEEHMDVLKPAVVLGEGGFGVSGFMKMEDPLFAIGVGEKGTLWLRLEVATKTLSHSSSPPKEYATSILLGALNRLLTLDSEVQMNPVMDAFVASVSKQNALFKKLLSFSYRLPYVGSRLLGPMDENPYIRATVRNTVAITEIHGSEVGNSISPNASALVDCRLLPKVSEPEFLEKVRNLIDDPRVHIEVTHRSPSGVSSFTSTYFEAICEALKLRFPQSIPAPFLLPASTDLTFFRAKGIPCYGIFPAAFTFEEFDRIHGTDERVSVKNLNHAHAVTSEILTRWLEI